MTAKELRPQIDRSGELLELLAALDEKKAHWNTSMDLSDDKISANIIFIVFCLDVTHDDVGRSNESRLVLS